MATDSSITINNVPKTKQGEPARVRLTFSGSDAAIFDYQGLQQAIREAAAARIGNEYSTRVNAVNLAPAPEPPPEAASAPPVSDPTAADPQ